MVKYPPTNRLQPKRDRFSPPTATLVYQWPANMSQLHWDSTGDGLQLSDDGPWVTPRLITDSSMFYQALILLLDTAGYQNGPDAHLVDDSRVLHHEIGLDEVNQQTIDLVANLLGVYIAIYNSDTGRWTVSQFGGNRILLMVYHHGVIWPLVYHRADKHVYQVKFQLDDPLLATIGLSE